MKLVHGLLHLLAGHLRHDVPPAATTTLLLLLLPLPLFKSLFHQSISLHAGHAQLETGWQKGNAQLHHLAGTPGRRTHNGGDHAHAETQNRRGDQKEFGVLFRMAICIHMLAVLVFFFPFFFFFFLIFILGEQKRRTAPLLPAWQCSKGGA